MTFDERNSKPGKSYLAETEQVKRVFFNAVNDGKDHTNNGKSRKYVQFVAACMSQLLPADRSQGKPVFFFADTRDLPAKMKTKR